MQGEVLFAGENLNGKNRNSHYCTSGPTQPRVTGTFQGAVFVSESCLNQLAQTGCPKATEMYSLPVLEARNPKPRCRQGHTPSGASWGGCFSPILASGGSWCSVAASPQSHLASLPVFLSLLSLIRALIELGPILVRHNLTSILTLLISAKILSPNKVLRFWLDRNLGVGVHSLTHCSVPVGSTQRWTFRPRGELCLGPHRRTWPNEGSNPAFDSRVGALPWHPLPLL